MPIEILETPAYLRMVFRGVVTGQDFVDAMVSIQKHDDGAGPAPNRLADLTDLETRDLSPEVVRKFAVWRRTAVMKNAVKSAIVAPSPATRGFARMFQTLNDHPQITVRIFETEAEAIAWLTEA